MRRQLAKFGAWVRGWRWRQWCLALLTAGVSGTAAANLFIVSQANGKVYDSVVAIPQRQVGLVLGAAPGTVYFNSRIAAAAELYQAGKVEHLLVSGDNHVSWYDEPTAMREALVARGVPATAITCDFAGFRTLDSVMRSRSVFGLTRVTVVSQEFHNRRAIAVARRHGIDAIGYNASPVPVTYQRRVQLREILARNLAVLDLYVWHRQPRFPGPFEPIELADSN